MEKTFAKNSEQQEVLNNKLDLSEARILEIFNKLTDINEINAKYDEKFEEMKKFILDKHKEEEEKM